MATGSDLVRVGSQVIQVVRHYSTGGSRLTGVDGYTDCSGLQHIIVAHADPSIPMPDDSVDQAKFCRDHGVVGISYEQALWIPGALAFEGPNGNAYMGFGPNGHVGMMVGDGVHSIEARSSHMTPQVGIYDARNRPFCLFGLIPRISYPWLAQHQNGSPQGQQSPNWSEILQFITAAKRTIVKPGSRGILVGTIQRRLSDLGFNEFGMVDINANTAVYGFHTTHAVQRFQGSRRLTVDGVVGPQTWGQLYP